MQQINKGIQLAILTAIISGVAIFINKFAVGTITPPLVFTAVKNTLVGIIILSLLIGTTKWQQIKTLSKNQYLKLGMIGLVGGALPFYLFFTGLSQIPAINAALIHKTLVIWVAILAYPFLKEKLTNWQLVAVAILFASNFVIGGFQGFTFSMGELMVLGATMLWAVETIIAKKILANTDPDIVTAARMGIGSIILLSAAAILYPQSLVQSLQLSNLQFFWMLATAATLLGYVMTWYRALKIAPATLVATVLVGATLVTNVLSAIFITQTLNSSTLIQAAMILTGIGLFICQARQTIKKNSNDLAIE
jgi:drug/metabolite transporter (DMT)-like permease